MNRALPSELKHLLSRNEFLSRRPLAVLMSLALLVYSALGVVETDAAQHARHLLLLGSIWTFFAGPRELRRSPVFWLLAAAVLVSLLSWALSLATHPNWAESSPKVNRTANWLVGIAIAFAIGGNLRRGLLAWGLAGFALLLAPWLTGDGWPEIWRGLHGERVDFRLLNAEHAGLYYSVLSLGLLALLPRAFRVARYRFATLLLWGSALAGSTTAIVITQTRSMWLGLAVALILLGGLKGFHLIRHRLWRWVSAFAVAVAAIPLLAMFINIDIVEGRFADEESTLQVALTGERADIPFDSTGIRIHSWYAAMDWLAQRPLLGWGGKGRLLVMAESEGIPEAVQKSFRHLHNSYLDAAVNYGGVGVALLLLIWLWFIRAALQAARRGELPPDVLHFFLCFMALWAVVNFFESFVFYTSGIYVFSLVSGLILSCYWRSTLQRDAITTAATEQISPRP